MQWVTAHGALGAHESHSPALCLVQLPIHLVLLHTATLTAEYTISYPMPVTSSLASRFWTPAPVLFLQESVKQLRPNKS